MWSVVPRKYPGSRGLWMKQDLVALRYQRRGLHQVCNIAHHFIADFQNQISEEANEQYKAMHQVYLEMKREGLTPPATTYNTLLQWCVRVGNSHYARKIYSDMEKDGLSPDEQTLVALKTTTWLPGVRHKVTPEKSDEQFNILQEMYNQLRHRGETPPSTTYDILIQWHIKKRRRKTAETMYTEMTKKGLTPDRKTLLALSSKVASFPKLYNMIQKLQEAGEVPTLDTCNVLLLKYAKNKKIDEAEAFFKDLQETMKLKPDKRTYEILIGMYLKFGNNRKAEDLLEEMEKSWCPPDDNTYLIFFTSYSEKATNYNRTCDYYKKLKHPSLNTISEMIETHAKNNNRAEAERLFRELKERGIVPTRQAYTTAIICAMKRGDLDETEKLFLELRDHGIKPAPRVYSSMFLWCYSKSDHELANLLFQEMKGSVRPIALDFKMLILVHAKAGLSAQVQDFFQEMLATNLKPDLVTFQTVLNIYVASENAEMAERMLTLLPQFNIEPDHITYATIIEMYGLHPSSSFTKSLLLFTLHFITALLISPLQVREARKLRKSRTLLQSNDGEGHHCGPTSAAQPRVHVRQKRIHRKSERTRRKFRKNHVEYGDL